MVERLELLEKDLKDLFEGRVMVLRIFPFASEGTCKKWKYPLENSSELNRYSNATDVSVNRIGMTLFETEGKPEKMEDYFRTASGLHAMVDKIINLKIVNPLKKIQAGLAKAWDEGCEVESLNGRMMNPGIIRSFEADDNGGLPPHIDTLYKDLPTCNEFKKMKSQLAANLYLSTPNEGGELEVWDFTPSTEELQNLFSGNHDFIDREKIPVKPILIKPRIGELVLFRSNCVHSVRASKGGMRTAASCFIGYYDDESPLTVWA